LGKSILLRSGENRKTKARQNGPGERLEYRGPSSAQGNEGKKGDGKKRSDPKLRRTGKQGIEKETKDCRQSDS